MKTRAMLSVLALAALAACGDKDDGQTGDADTTATSTVPAAAPSTMPVDSTTMAAPPAAPMGADSMGAMNGTAGAGQTDTLVKVDSTKKM